MPARLYASTSIHSRATYLGLAARIRAGAPAAALLSEKHKARLNGYILSANLIEKADGGKFWRVMTSQMPAQEAAAICDALKRAGQDCIVRKTQSTQ